jgi:hypothetical protein
MCSCCPNLIVGYLVNGVWGWLVIKVFLPTKALLWCRSHLKGKEMISPLYNSQGYARSFWDGQQILFWGTSALLWAACFLFILYLCVSGSASFFMVASSVPGHVLSAGIGRAGPLLWLLHSCPHPSPVFSSVSDSKQSGLSLCYFLIR